MRGQPGRCLQPPQRWACPRRGASRRASLASRQGGGLWVPGASRLPSLWPWTKRVPSVGLGLLWKTGQGEPNLTRPSKNARASCQPRPQETAGSGLAIKSPFRMRKPCQQPGWPCRVTELYIKEPALAGHAALLQLPSALVEGSESWPGLAGPSKPPSLCHWKPVCMSCLFVCLFVFHDRILINSAHTDLIEIIGRVLQVTVPYRLRQ